MSGRTVTASNILVGLMREDDFSLWQHFGMVIDQLERMPEILGESWLEEKVTVTGVLQARIKLYDAVLRTDFGSVPYARHIRKMICAMGDSNYKLLDQLGEQFDMHEPNNSNHLKFNKKVKQLYEDKLLTYRDLLRLQPGVFMPLFDPTKDPFGGQ